MKIRVLVCIAALFALFAASCSSDGADSASDNTSATTDETAVDDDKASADDQDDGGEVAVADENEQSSLRIVSLSPTATEMLFAIGAGDQVVAVDNFSNFPEDAPMTGLSGYEPNVEAIVGFEPDLVVSSGPIAGLAEVGVENFVFDAAVTLDDVYTQLEQLGALTGHLGDAAELAAQMQTDIDAVVASLPERETPLTYYHELDNTLFSVTSSTFIGQVYELLGLVNVADPADADGSAYGYPQLNEEFLVDADPDIIFLADTVCCAQNADLVAERPGWDQLSAVQAGNIVELNDDIVSRWGPRIVEFLQIAGDAVAEIEAVPAG